MKNSLAGASLRLIRLWTKRSVRLFLRLSGIQLLTKEQTETYLEPYQLGFIPESRMLLPAVNDSTLPEKVVFDQVEAIAPPDYVWSYVSNGGKAVQLAYGNILADKKILCANYGSHHIIRNFVRWRHRRPYSAKVIIAPWSHYVDGVMFGGYYDFLILVAAKLCRIKDFLPEKTFAQAIVSYPLFKTTYERELLALIGISQDRVVDSRIYKVRFEECVIGTSGHWFYPNIADVLSLKKHIEGSTKIQRTKRNRVYISRSGRRRIVNEDALLNLLKKYHFTVIEDKPRTVVEQIAIYKNASFIMGPHGASFTNVIWCEPDTHLFELFSADYAPDHFRYLASVMQMTYSAYYFGTGEDKEQKAVSENIYVSLTDMEGCLSQLLDESYSENSRIN